MAKGQGSGEDRAKVKLRVIEFELEGGNAAVENSIRQLTHALTTRNGTATKPLPLKQAKELASGEVVEQEPEEIDDSEVTDAEATEAAPPKTKGAKSTYKPRVPTYIHDLDLTGSGPSFKEFAHAKKPKKNTQRHLVAAFWLKEYGDSPTINIDKVYTCYRTIDWSTSMPDWDVNFRQQAPTNRFRRVNPGEYAINPVGEDDVRKTDGTA